MSARSDILAEFAGLGLPDDTIDAFLAAVTAAGYDLTPNGGGSPVAASAAVPSATVKSVPGRPGWFVTSVEFVSGVYFHVLTLPTVNPDGTRGVNNVPLGSPTSSSGASA